MRPGYVRQIPTFRARGTLNVGNTPTYVSVLNHRLYQYLCSIDSMPPEGARTAASGGWTAPDRKAQGMPDRPYAALRVAALPTLLAWSPARLDPGDGARAA